MDRIEIEKKERVELLSFQDNEIDLVDPKENEDHVLKTSFVMYSNIIEIIKTLPHVNNTTL